MKNRKRNIVFGTVFLILLILVVFLVQVNLVLRDEAPQKIAVPELRLTLNDVALDEIKENGKEIKYPGNKLTLGELSFDNVEVKGRGNATWAQAKKPYQIKLAQKANLLGLGERRKWILLANFVDNTNLRTDTAFYLEKMLGDKFAYEGEFVELYINDDYEGLYYLVRGIEIGKNAVDLKDSLGVLVELDNAYAKNESEYYITNGGEHLTIKDARTKDYANVAMEDFMVNFNALELAVGQKDFESIAQLIDVESFARYYLLEEFIVNPDAYFTSQYFYKDGPEDKIHAGPAWDFDIALDLWNETSPTFEYTKSHELAELGVDEQYGNRSRLFARLVDVPEFRAEVGEVFQTTLLGRKNELLRHIFERAAKIYPMAIKDGEKWEKGECVKSVKNLLKWVSARYDYFEWEYGTKKYENYPFYDINVIEV